MTVGLLSFATQGPRVLLVLYGQSNMENFSQVSTGSPPAAGANTFYYDGTSIGAVPAADGLRWLLNTIQSASGLPVLALNGSAGGASSFGLSKPAGAIYAALISQITAVILPTDRVFILWDQGEGDADATPHPVENDYKATINQLHLDIVTDIGRIKANCPFLMSGLGTTSVTDGGIGSGTTDGSWQTIKNAIFNCSVEQSFNHFSHTNIDFVRADVYHYDGASQAKQGKRFAQTVLTIMGLASGEAHCLISNGATVDATHTNINIVHSAGTDFTPTSALNGWETSGDNGATWSAATGVRNSATQVQLTHASLSTTNTRLVRYQSGMLPPNASGVNPTTAPLLDNGPVQAPLAPTTWDIRPTPLSTLPVPTWRYAVALLNSTQVQTKTGFPLGPSIGAQKFVVLSLTGPFADATVTLTPRDISGNALGSPVVMSLVKRQGSAQIQQATLPSAANGAYSVDISADYGANPFAGTIAQLWTVPLADLSSTTAAGVGGASVSSALAATATVSVSAGGLIIHTARSTANYTAAAVITGDNVYAKRWEFPSGIATYSADASNCAASAASSVTATFQNSGNVDIALAAWR